MCEWKGRAAYLDLVAPDGRVAVPAAWTYPAPDRRPSRPWPTTSPCTPGRSDEVTVAGEVVRPQPGGFYGGWVTDDVVGPFKGGPGSTGW